MSLAPNAALIDVNEHALRLLIAEMGLVNTARFIQQFTTGSGDSVADKDRLYGQLRVADIVAAIRASKPSEATDEPSG